MEHKNRKHVLSTILDFRQSVRTDAVNGVPVALQTYSRFQCVGKKNDLIS